MTREQSQPVLEGPRLDAVLVDLARADSPARVRATLAAAVRGLAGAEGCLLLAAEADGAGPRPAADAGEAGAVVALDRAGALARIVGAGRAVELAATDARAKELPLSPGIETLLIVPCAGAGSRLALCLLWRSAAAPGGEVAGVLAAAACMALERLEAERRERLQRHELQNRIRNAVATIRTVSTRSAERAESLHDYMLHFGGRLDAMARHHVALARTADSRPDLEDLLRAELLAEGLHEGPKVVLEGARATLTQDEAEALGLALHELTVNSVKFGPFSGRGGSLSVRWWRATGPRGATRRIEWREACDLPAPRGPYRIGFGRHMVERALPYEVGAETELAIGPDGLCCSIAIPDREAPA